MVVFEVLRRQTTILVSVHNLTDQTPAARYQAWELAALKCELLSHFFASRIKRIPAVSDSEPHFENQDAEICELLR